MSEAKFPLQSSERTEKNHKILSEQLVSRTKFEIRMAATLNVELFLGLINYVQRYEDVGELRYNSTILDLGTKCR